MNFKDLSLEEIIAKIKSWATTSIEVKAYFMNRIEKFDGDLNSFNFVNKEVALGETESMLAGIPLWVKDIFCEKGIPTTAASKILADFVPPYNSTVIDRLQEAGMTSVGKLNMDDTAMGTTGENSAFWPTKNPWGVNRIPGGSSSWSAASVAAGLVPAALGTDTGWSLRQPASMCNVVGFRPSYGRNSRYGIIPMASSFDCPGTITKTVKDAALLYDIMNGEDPLENTTYKWKDTLDKTIFDKKDMSGIKVWVPKEYFEEGLDADVREKIVASIEKCRSLGAEIVDVSLPMTKYAIAAYYIIVPAEVSTNVGRLDGIRYGHNSKEAYASMDELYMNNRGEGLWKEVKRRSIVGAYVLSAGFYDAYFKKASQVRTMIINEFNDVFNSVDVLLTPPTPSAAWKLGEKSEDPLKLYLADAYTIPASLAGLPGISVPAGFVEQDGETLPVWVQFLANTKQEQKLLQVAHIFEQATGYGKQNPVGFED
jgi:aspartyl-tRNA(Asn)/glutamyl-tRNA(Gln) amidotransferase subunit A